MELKLNLIYNKMKKITAIFLLLLLLGCVREEDLTVPESNIEVPEALIIDELQGIKLENIVVYERVAMNVKLPTDGTYRIKIKHGLNSELISQERIQGKEGDNILKVYVSALEKSSYRLELTKDNHELIGVTVFSKF